MKIKTTYIYKVVTVLIIAVLTVCMLFACTGKKEDAEVPGENVIEYKANSPLGIAESHIGGKVQDLIEEVGTLTGGYEGTYEFDGFTAKTYAKSEDADAVVTEIIPDEESEVYKESLKTQDDGGDK